MAEDKGLVYLASGIFNVNTNLYNARLATKLAESGYRSYLPQRDGFEVARFIDFLNHIQSMPDAKKYASEIGGTVPYYLDLGFFMSQSIALVANLDDPIDSGMVVEMSYAKLCNIPVIGVRTDIRSPLGNVAAPVSINPFPVQQCDTFMHCDTPTGGEDEVVKMTNNIIDAIVGELDKWVPIKKNQMRESDNPGIKKLIEGSDKLFTEVPVHSPFTEDDMSTIAKQYLKYKDSFFDKVKPEITEFPPKSTG